jgi:hypothetical protein
MTTYHQQQQQQQSLPSTKIDNDCQFDEAAASASSAAAAAPADSAAAAPRPVAATSSQSMLCATCAMTRGFLCTSCHVHDALRALQQSVDGLSDVRAEKTAILTQIAELRKEQHAAKVAIDQLQREMRDVIAKLQTALFTQPRPTTCIKMEGTTLTHHQTIPQHHQTTHQHQTTQQQEQMQMQQQEQMQTQQQEQMQTQQQDGPTGAVDATSAVSAPLVINENIVYFAKSESSLPNETAGL